MDIKFIKRIISVFTLVAFVATSVPSSFAQTLPLPQPGSMVSLSAAYQPPVLQGVKVYPDNPFRLDFILNKGDALDAGSGREPSLQDESQRLIKYFLAALTVPEKDLWVNLSPYEKDRIVPEAFGLTEMGRDLLGQDYLLKQITASVIYPEGETGKKFWAKVYQKAQEKYGTTEIPVDTFNKVWIVPDKAVVFENPSATAGEAVAFVVESRLKVMLESDYTALSQAVIEGGRTSEPSETQELAKNIIREIVIPVLEQEVNEGKNFAALRQVYQSLILAAWYKKKIKESILSKVYVDQKKVQGVNIDDPQESEKIWAKYVEAFKKGAYNYIKEEKDLYSEEMIPRKYFSGGFDFAMSGKLTTTQDMAMVPSSSDPLLLLPVDIVPEQSFTSKLAGTGSKAFQQPTVVRGPGHETASYLDRHQEQWTVLQESIIPRMIVRARERVSPGERPEIRITDLGVSSAEETARVFYEMVLALQNSGEDPLAWDISIKGYDIDPQMIEAGRRRINGEEPFLSQGGVYAGQIMSMLEKYPKKFRESVQLIEEDITRIPGQDLSGADLIMINHVLRNFEESERGVLIRQLSQKSPDAILAVGDLDRMKGNWWSGSEKWHVFSSASYYTGRTRYYFGIPSWGQSEIDLGFQLESSSEEDFVEGKESRRKDFKRRQRRDDFDYAMTSGMFIDSGRQALVGGRYWVGNELIRLGKVFQFLEERSGGAIIEKEWSAQKLEGVFKSDPQRSYSDEEVGFFVSLVQKIISMLRDGQGGESVLKAITEEFEALHAGDDFFGGEEGRVSAGLPSGSYHQEISSLLGSIGVPSFFAFDLDLTLTRSDRNNFNQLVDELNKNKDSFVGVVTHRILFYEGDGAPDLEALKPYENFFKEQMEMIGLEPDKYAFTIGLVMAPKPPGSTSPEERRKNPYAGADYYWFLRTKDADGKVREYLVRAQSDYQGINKFTALGMLRLHFKDLFRETKGLSDVEAEMQAKQFLHRSVLMMADDDGDRVHLPIIGIPQTDRQKALMDSHAVVAYDNGLSDLFRVARVVIDTLPEKGKQQDVLRFEDYVVEGLRKIVRHANFRKNTVKFFVKTDGPKNTDSAQKGGIDLTADRLDLQTGADGGRSGVRFNVDPAQLQAFQNAPGFVPVIMNIQPLESLPRFLGVKSGASSVLTTG